jgi:hypothetical protein
MQRPSGFLEEKIMDETSVGEYSLRPDPSRIRFKVCSPDYRTILLYPLQITREKE